MAWWEEVTDQTRTRPSPPPDITLFSFVTKEKLPGMQRRKRGRTTCENVGTATKNKSGIEKSFGDVVYRSCIHGWARCVLRHGLARFGQIIYD